MLTYETIKIVIDITTSVLTILIAPVVLMQLLSFGLSRLKLKGAIRAGFAGLKMGYPRLLIVSAGFMLIGFLLAIVLSGIDSTALRKLVELLGYTLLGGVSTYIIYKTGIQIYAKGGKSR